MIMPGVETKQHEDTMIGQIRLDRYGIQERMTGTILGLKDHGCVDARMVNGASSQAPLPRAEADLVRDFFGGDFGSIREWTSNRLSRHGIQTSKMRRFRRQTSSSILLWRMGNVDDMAWLWDRMPGRRDPVTEPADIGKAKIIQKPLFPDILEKALADYRDMETISEWTGRRILGIDWPLYDRNEELEVVYSDDLALFRKNALSEFG